MNLCSHSVETTRLVQNLLEYGKGAKEAVLDHMPLVEGQHAGKLIVGAKFRDVSQKPGDTQPRFPPHQVEKAYL